MNPYKDHISEIGSTHIRVIRWGWAAIGIYTPNLFPLKPPNAVWEVSKFCPIQIVFRGPFPLFLSHKITCTLWLNTPNMRHFHSRRKIFSCNLTATAQQRDRPLAESSYAARPFKSFFLKNCLFEIMPYWASLLFCGFVCTKCSTAFILLTSLLLCASRASHAWHQFYFSDMKCQEVKISSISSRISFTTRTLLFKRQYRKMEAGCLSHFLQLHMPLFRS